MRVNRGFLAQFVNRFQREMDDAWLCAQMQVADIPSIDESEDAAMLFQAMQVNFEKIYVPCKDSIRIGRWIYSLARGFVAYRYQSPLEYVDICMSQHDAADPKLQSILGFSPDAVPIYAVDGLPGSGKSAFFRALRRAFPAPQIFATEGDPPQQVGTVSALWVSVNANFGLKTWMQETLMELGVPLGKSKGFNTVGSLTPLMFKTLYRTGVAAIIVDELQFASGLSSARRVLGQLLAMREFGVPIFFFANTDLLLTIERAPAQLAQRIPRDKKTFSPLLRNDDAYKEILIAQLNLVPFGHAIDVGKEVQNIYDMVAGLPRASARLIELGAPESIAQKRPLTMLDLIEAKRSPSFDALRQHISLLTAIAPVDSKKHPELASNNDQFDARNAYEQQIREQRIQDAAALGLYASMSETEREASRAVETKILRESGKIPGNVQAVGEAKRRRKPKPLPDDVLKNSYAAQKLSKFPAKNPTSRS